MNQIEKEMLKTVAAALGEDLRKETVFVGGVTTSIYIENELSPQNTATQDVDLIINVTSLSALEVFEKEIGKRGFKRDLLEPGPMCRFKLGSLSVDFMPLDPKILGFSNRWYKRGYETAETFELDQLTIRVLSFPYFLATKIEAFSNRGGKDYRDQKDFEDIVVTLAGRKMLLTDLTGLPMEIKILVRDQLNSLLKDETLFKEGLTANLSEVGYQIATQRAQMLLATLKKFCEMTNSI